MIDFEIQGAIFDVDDTLLDNRTDAGGMTLHERSRLAAVHEVGRRHGIIELQNVTREQNLNAFLEAPVHTLDAAVWNILLGVGLADSDVINPEHPLQQEIVTLKNSKHIEVLRKHGKEVPGATAFVRALSETIMAGRLAIASTAVRQDVDIFLGMTKMTDLFPEERIITKEKTTHHKPHPEAFDRAFLSLGIDDADRSRVCAFEDDPRGIMSAKAAGLYVCAITTRFDRANLTNLEVAPDLVADSYAEFADLFGLDR